MGTLSNTNPAEIKFSEQHVNHSATPATFEMERTKFSLFPIVKKTSKKL